MSIKDDVLAELLKQDDLLATGQLFMAAAVLLASVILGANEKAIAIELEYDQQFVDQVGHRLRDGKVWLGDHLNPMRWDAWQGEFGLAFLMDAMIGEGVLAYGGIRSGEVAYKVAGSGQTLAELRRKTCN